MTTISPYLLKVLTKVSDNFEYYIDKLKSGKADKFESLIKGSNL